MKIPNGLNPDQSKCYTEIVLPQLEELYSYQYDRLELDKTTIHISEENKLHTEQIKQIMASFPKKDTDLISDIYFVSYDCKNESENHSIYGRTLPIIYKILIYPKAHKKLDVILAHEIGHVFFEKRLSKTMQLAFASKIIHSFPVMISWSKEKRDKFIKEEFADCYDNFINNPDRLKKYDIIYDFFIQFVK